MPDIVTWLASRGMTVSSTSELIEMGVALVLAILALAAGWYVDRHWGNALANFWARHAGVHTGGISPRLCVISRHVTAAALLAIVANAWAWHALAALGLAFALGSAAALAIKETLRGLGVPRWAAWTMATIAFVSILGHRMGGLDAIRATLDSIGLNVGARRISALSVVTAAVIVVVLYAAVRLSNRLIGHAIGGARGLDPTQRLLAQKLVSIAIVTLAFFLGIDLLGIDLTSLAVFSGAFGLAVGFGLQKTIGNLIAGIILLMDRSIKPGDVIVVGQTFGWVNKIGVRAVSIITRDGKEYLIPNENLMTEQVENWSYTDRNVRIRIPVGVAYTCNLKLAQELMLRAAMDSPRVLDTPKPNVWLTEFGEFAVRHEILVWINDPESGVGSVRSDVLNRLWVLFKEHGIKVPYPQREVSVKAWPEPHERE